MAMRLEVIGLTIYLALATPALRAAEGDAAGASAPLRAGQLLEGQPTTDTLRPVPGALGDLGKSIEFLPGVSRSGYVDERPIVRGADPGDTRVLVDGMEIPILYHLGGARSVVGSAMVDSMVLLPGGYAGDLGRALGGIVKIETRPPPLGSYWGDFDVNLLDASFAVGAGADGGGIAVGGRSSFIGHVSNEAPTDTPWLDGSLRYRDLQATALLPLRQGEQIELIGLYSSDFESPDFGLVPIAFPTRTQSFLRLGARYTRHEPDGTRVNVVPFVGSDRSRINWKYPYIPAEASLAGKNAGLRASYRKPLTQSLMVDLGFDGLVNWSNLYRLGDPNIPAREGDMVLLGEQLSSGGIAREGWAVTMANLAPSVTLEFAVGNWRLIPSFRADLEVISADREMATGAALERLKFSRLAGAPAPRLLISHQSSLRVRNHVAVGLYHQAPSPADMGSKFGSPFLGLSHALHVVAGTTVALLPGLTLWGTAFYRQLWALVTRNPSPVPPLGELLVQEGQGRAWGAEFLVHIRSSSVLSGWLSYTLSRSERRQTASAAYRLFDYDQTHVLSAVATASYAGFSLGARLRLASGMPRTPVTGAFYDSTSAGYYPIFGPQNSDRLPMFCALDVRLEKTFRAKGLAFTPYVEALNLTNRKNAVDYAYSMDFRQRDTVTGLPRTVVAGIALGLAGHQGPEQSRAALGDATSAGRRTAPPSRVRADRR